MDREATEDILLEGMLDHYDLEFLTVVWVPEEPDTMRFEVNRSCPFQCDHVRALVLGEGYSNRLSTYIDA